MSLRVVITEQAEREMQSVFNWWAEHRSKRQADRWYAGLLFSPLLFFSPRRCCTT
jgi:hypothetical protein